MISESFMMNPKISVIMPVFNGEKYLNESIESILNQTFGDYEFIIVDDASKDKSGDIIKYYSSIDSRIKVINNKENLKISKSLNKAITESNSKLIARMDADDVSLPERLQMQYEFMNENPNVAVSGGWLKEYESGNIWKPPTDNESIKAGTLFNSRFIHPTIIMRKEILLKYTQLYSSEMEPSEDYYLWAQLSLHRNVMFTNIPEILLLYRTHPDTPRTEYKIRQNVSAGMVRENILRNIGIYADKNELDLHNQISTGSLDNRLRKDYAKWLAKLEMHCVKVEFCSKKAIKAELHERINKLNYIESIKRKAKTNRIFKRIKKVILSK